MLNSTDSKFAGYKFLSRSDEETQKWIKMMESLEAQGHSMDNMRSLIWLDSITDYAFNTDILHLVELAVVLDGVYMKLDDDKNADFRDEIGFFLHELNELLFHEYGIDYGEFG